MFVVIINVFIL